jgi:cytoskeleton protein RodZ
MQSVGERLCAARLDLGLSLEQVSERTRISVKNLRAIEADKLDVFDSAFFYKSFVRQFATELGIDYGLLSEAVQAAAVAYPEPRMPGHGNAPSLRVSRLRPKRTGGLRWAFSFASLAIMLVACSSVYAFWQDSRADIQSTIAHFVSSVTSSDHSGQSHLPRKAPMHARAKPLAASVSQLPAVTPSIFPVFTNISVAAIANSFELKLSAFEATWLSVATDGKEIFSGILRPAETKVLEGYETARIRTGNAGGLNVEFNGKSIGSLGPRGQVRTVIFTKDTYEIVPAVAHIALAGFNSEGE